MFTILVVDDDAAMAGTVARKLHADGRRILTANGAQQAMRHFADGPIDVILSDDHMPGQNGRDLLAALRQTHPDTVRILMTGQPTLESALAALNGEVIFRYLTKPFSSETLQKIVDEAVAKRRTGKPSKPDEAAERRRRMRAELEREHPGLLTVEPGPYTPSDDGETMDLRIEAVFANQPLPPLKTGLDPVRIADQLLRICMRSPSWCIVVEPNHEGHQVVVDGGDRVMHILTIDSSLGDAVAARLATIAGLDLAKTGHQSGQVTVVCGKRRGEAMIAMSTSAMGLSAELRRLGESVAEEENMFEVVGEREPYRLLEEIGRGGLGVVYRAVHTGLERPVAIKVLRDQLGQEPLAVARLLREARAATRARHPGIVSVLNYGRFADRRPYIVMELVEAPTLDQLLQDKPLTVEQTMLVARGLAIALAAAHDVGVLHRDLKPSNIFVDEDWNVKISDFGAAKLLNDEGPQLTAVGTAIGTPHYMSPEQARNDKVDRRADLYSLGCVIFEMLSGKTPYDGESSIEVITHHILSEIPTVTSPHGPLPLSIVRAVRRAMAKNPSERHQTARELLADLEQAESALQRKGWRRWLP